MTKEITLEILDAFREGDHKAFEDIFVAYFNKIKIFIFGFVKSEADAEELADNIFISLWENRESVDTQKSFNSYLYTIARNTSLNFLKHKLVRENYIGQQSYSQQQNNSSEDELIAKETAMLIDMIVDKMPAQRKMIYVLSRKEGLSNDEIAIRLDTTKRNVESQISLALKDIRKIIIPFMVILSM